MSPSRKVLALIAAASLAAAGCATDDAAERDANDAANEIEREAEEAGKDIENAVPGDADDDGK